MTDNNHPIIPSPELLQEWATEYWGNPGEPISQGERYIAIEAARWGADQELEAILALAKNPSDSDEDCYFDGFTVAGIRGRRRPKPPSLKELALKAVQNIDDACESEGFSVGDDTDIIRRALEPLPD